MGVDHGDGVAGVGGGVGGGGAVGGECAGVLADGGV